MMRRSVMRPPAILAICCSLLLGSQLVSSASLGSDDTASPTQYNVGIGIADNTGPAAEIGMVRCSDLFTLEAQMHVMCT